MQYCDFFIALLMTNTWKESCTTADFGREAYQSLKLSFEKCIVPELTTGRLREKVEAQGFVKDLLNDFLADIFKS